MSSDVKYEVNAGFFDAINNDRVYSAEDMNMPYTKLISEGVFATPQGEPSTELQVFSANSGMNVVVSAGNALLGKKWFENPSNLTITISQNSDIVSRIDSIIAQIDRTQAGRKGCIIYRQGSASSNPVHPDINTEENIFELRLADILVSPSCVQITQSLITDCRGTEDCPWITSLLKQVDVSTLYAQWQAAYQEYYDKQEEIFETWFEGIKNQLGEDVVGNLLSQLDNKLNISSPNYIKSISENNDKSEIEVTKGDSTTDIIKFKGLPSCYNNATHQEGIYNENNNINDINSVNYLYEGIYMFGITASTLGIPSNIKQTTRVQLKTYSTYISKSNIYSKYIIQELYVPELFKQYRRFVNYSSDSSISYSEWKELERKFIKHMEIIEFDEGIEISNGMQIQFNESMYIVGSNILKVYWNGVLLLNATNTNIGHYKEIGNKGEYSRRIEFYRTEEEGDYILTDKVILIIETEFEEDKIDEVIN